MADNLFNILEDKKFRNGGAGSTGGNFQFSIKIRYLEIVDEEVRDLLQQGNFNNVRNAMNVVLNEWEGPTVNGIQWVPMTNQH
jgi:hypothetical protein